MAVDGATLSLHSLVDKKSHPCSQRATLRYLTDALRRKRAGRSSLGPSFMHASPRPLHDMPLSSGFLHRHYITE